MYQLFYGFDLASGTTLQSYRHNALTQSLVYMAMPALTWDTIILHLSAIILYNTGTVLCSCWINTDGLFRWRVHTKTENIIVCSIRMFQCRMHTYVPCRQGHPQIVVYTLYMQYISEDNLHYLIMSPMISIQGTIIDTRCNNLFHEKLFRL